MCVSVLYAVVVFGFVAQEHPQMYKFIHIFHSLSFLLCFSLVFFRFCFDVSLLALLRLCSLYETCIIKNNANGNFVLFFTNKNGFGRPRKRAVVAPKWSKVCERAASIQRVFVIIREQAFATLTMISYCQDSSAHPFYLFFLKTFDDCWWRWTVGGG